MAPNKGPNRAREFEDLLESAPQDFDPEADDVADEDSDGSDDLDVDAKAGEARDHYADVGKSKLRKGKTAPLGPQYRGTRVEREAFDEEEDDENDPFSKGFDEESDEEEDEDDMDDEEDDSAEDDIEGSDDDMEDGTSETDLSDDDDSETRAQAEQENQAAAKKAMVEEEREAASSISLASKVDAEKGRAVKKQRAGFDSLLNTRMKLQKAMIGVNSAVDIPEDTLQDEQKNAKKAIEAAETAAFNLWSSLNQFRDDLLASKTGEKRKASSITIDSPTDDLWNHMQKQEKKSMPDRTTTLQKWYEKAPGQAAATDRNKINNAASKTTIMDVIHEQLSNQDRLVKRAQTPRSCAPVQVSKKVTEDPKIYDDADFYGLLLKDLLEQKSQDSVAASNIDVSFQMRRDAKTKKNVDTKASKGRKLRYTVHEKLQNFMAPEDRTMWGERQTDELFGSLFGQRLALGEDEEKNDQPMDDEIDPNEASLMLFRN